MRIHGSDTVSVLIFVGWFRPFIVASCPHVLGAHVTAARKAAVCRTLSCMGRPPGPCRLPPSSGGVLKEL